MQIEDISVERINENSRKEQNNRLLTLQINKILNNIHTYNNIEKTFNCPYCLDAEFLPYINESINNEYVARCYCVEDYKIVEYISKIDDKILNEVNDDKKKELELTKRHYLMLKRYAMFSQIKNYSLEKFNIRHTEILLIRDTDGNKLYPRGYLDYFIEYKNKYFRKLGE